MVGAGNGRNKGERGGKRAWKQTKVRVRGRGEECMEER